MKKLWRKIREAVAEWIARNVVVADPAEATPAAQEPAAEPAAAPAATAVDWRYGGFNGARAEEDPRCRISSFRTSSSGCSLKWESGIPGDWRRDKGLVVCAAFFLSGGKWVGGKFDWIDESRKTRDWKNIRGGYHGWDADAFFAAKRRAFCVVSADGRRRSAIIEEGA